MIYTIKFDLGIDDENIISETELNDAVSEALRVICADVSDFKLLEVND